jgi:hypothetical protein
LARKALYKHATQVDTNTYPDDGSSPVGSNEWNEAPDPQGMLGFTPATATITIASGAATVTDTITVVAAETGTTDTLDTLAITNTNEYDLVYLFADTGDDIELENTSNPSVDGQIRTVSNANETLSSTTPTILIRKGNYWYGYGGGVVNALNDIGDVTITSASSEQGLIYNGSAWVNEFPSLTGQYAKNSTGSTISKGKLVYISGYDIASGYPEISLADNTSSSTMAAIGVVREDILNNATGFVIVNGKLSDVDTSTFSVNAIVYVGTSGDFTTTKPTGTALIQNVGKVLRSHASNGQIEIISIGRTNDVPNIPNGTIWVGNASAVPTAVTPSGDATITNAGVISVSDLTITGETSQDLLYFDGANWVRLAKGTDGQVLKTESGSLAWGAGGGGATIVHTYSNTTNTAYTGTASSFGTVGVGDRDIYIKKIDANNEGVFTKIWKNGSAVEVQIA